MSVLSPTHSPALSLPRIAALLAFVATTSQLMACAAESTVADDGAGGSGATTTSSASGLPGSSSSSSSAGASTPGSSSSSTGSTSSGTSSSAGSTSASSGTAGSGPNVEAGFTPTPGTQCSVDRSAPCGADEVGVFRAAPENANVYQACLPNYQIWAPVVCGGPRAACTCDASQCLTGEAAKTVSGQFCVCLSLCSNQSDGSTCGASSERGCIPVDDVSGQQVFICGG